MTLYIDTADFQAVRFALAGAGRAKVYQKKLEASESHAFLVHLGRFLRTARVPFGAIERVVVSKGPGSYTGVRVGISIAKAFGLAWRVPVRAVSSRDMGRSFQKFVR